ITYNTERYRFTDGTWVAEKQPGHWTQWGLTHDDVGNLYWSTNSDPLAQAHLHPKYWGIPHRVAPGAKLPRVPVELPTPYTPDFLFGDSSCLLSDRGGTAQARRQFTSACGQSVYRGDKFPIDARGDYFFCDPTIHVVRRASVSRSTGLVSLSRDEPPGTEFLRSSDINSRFINTAEGPDGCLYITDMYRGIIQDAPWLNEQARANITEAGLHDNIRNGRIWRIRHRDFKPRRADEMPRMSEESTFALLRHLESPAGWWRDTAQREIILRDDRETVIPQLEAMARFTEAPLTRLQALWTLEGIAPIHLELLGSIAKDRDPRLRRAAIQIAEAALDDSKTFDLVARPLANDPDPMVAQQLILSLGMTPGHPDRAEVIVSASRPHSGSEGVRVAATLSLWEMRDLPFVQDIGAGTAFDAGTNSLWKNAFANWDRALQFPEDMPETERRRITGGEAIYFKNCVSCHGADRKGMGIPGTEHLLAPSLADSTRVKAEPTELIQVMLHGLIGPIEGKNYQAGFMAPAAALGITRDDRL
ncbi:MAG: c-type cytochrome, partial [Verrucomicrobiota bacterium]